MKIWNLDAECQEKNPLLSVLHSPVTNGPVSMDLEWSDLSEEKYVLARHQAIVSQ